MIFARFLSIEACARPSRHGVPVYETLARYRAVCPCAGGFGKDFNCWPVQPPRQRAGWRVAGSEIDVHHRQPAGFQIGLSFARLVVGHHVIDHAALQELADEIRSAIRPTAGRRRVTPKRRAARRNASSRAAQPERGAYAAVGKLIRQPTPRRVAIARSPPVCSSARRSPQPRRSKSSVAMPCAANARAVCIKLQGAFALFDERRIHNTVPRTVSGTKQVADNARPSTVRKACCVHTRELREG